LTGSDTKIDVSRDDKTHSLILYEPLAQRAIGPPESGLLRGSIRLDRGEVITKVGTLSIVQKQEIAIVEGKG